MGSKSLRHHILLLPRAYNHLGSRYARANASSHFDTANGTGPACKPREALDLATVSSRSLLLPSAVPVLLAMQLQITLQMTSLLGRVKYRPERCAVQRSELHCNRCLRVRLFAEQTAQDSVNNKSPKVRTMRHLMALIDALYEVDKQRQICDVLHTN